MPSSFIPRKELEAGDLETLDLGDKGIGVPGESVLVDPLRVDGSLTEVLVLLPIGTPVSSVVHSLMGYGFLFCLLV